MKSSRFNELGVLVICIVFFLGVRSSLKGDESIPIRASCSEKCEVDWEREAITMPLEDYQDLCFEVQQWRMRYEETR